MKKQARKADQAKVRLRKNISFRMNVLFFSIFILFSLLIFRLGYLQIVKSEDYVRELERTEEIAVNTSVPRGRIFDREGRVLVDNEPQNAITYTKTTSTTSKEMLEIAEELALLIEQDTKRVTTGDKKDFWILKNSDAAAEKVTAKEQKDIQNDRDLSKTQMQGQINRLTRERVTDEELDTLSNHDLEVLAIYREMMSGYAYSPQIIKSGDVTEEEFATVSERLSDLPGIDTTTDWERVRKSPNTILGTTTNPREGIPKSDLDYYLSRGYSRNDRVGRSFLELQYEELLQGQKTVVKNIKDRTGKVVETKTVSEGEPGKDLVLTIDTELQQALEDIVSNKLISLKRGGGSRYLDRAFLVILDPNTGEVLSLVGKQILRNSETGKLEVQDYAYGTFTTRYEMGSTVKMGTVLAGYEHGGATVGGTKIDEPIVLKGTPTMSSVFNRRGRIAVNDIQAIGRSSNVYMFKTAMGIGNTSYRYKGSFRPDLEAFDKMRATYSSLGLGTLTGIDLPGEVGGKPGDKVAGSLLHLAIGQYDTYSPLQLAQYVATIANGGYRIAPRVVKEIHEPSKDGKVLGPLVKETEIEVLNRINNTDREIEQMKKGMYYTYYGQNGTARAAFSGTSYVAAGKTGTAQAFAYDEERKKSFETISVTHVGFAPYDNPEIAYAVVVPHVSTNVRGKYPYPNNEIAREAVDKYFELKAKKEQQPVDETNTAQTIKPPFNYEKENKDE